MLAFASWDEFNGDLHDMCVHRIQTAAHPVAYDGHKYSGSCDWVGRNGSCAVCSIELLKPSLGTIARWCSLTSRNLPCVDLLLDGAYIADKRHIIFVGGPDTGKTHWASALGIEVATHGAKVRFFNVLDWVNQGGALLSQLHETTCVIMTTNLAFSEWGKLLAYEKTTSALLDRLIHHCDIVETRNDSDRFKNRS
jgi:IstB-like ATP binding protein